MQTLLRYPLKHVYHEFQRRRFQTLGQLGPLDIHANGFLPLLWKYVAIRSHEVERDRAAHRRFHPADSCLVVWSACSLLPHYHDRLRAWAYAKQAAERHGRLLPQSCFLLVPSAAWSHRMRRWLQHVLHEEGAARPHWVSLVRRCTKVGQKPPNPMKTDVLNITKCLNNFQFEDFANLTPEPLENVVKRT